MLVLVHLDDRVQPLLQRVTVRSEADDGEDNATASVFRPIAADLEEFGDEARVDVVAGCGASIACEDGEVGAGDT